MARDFSSSVRTNQSELTIDLNKKSYRKINVHILKDQQKPLRKTYREWIRKNINRSVHCKKKGSNKKRLRF